MIHDVGVGGVFDRPCIADLFTRRQVQFSHAAIERTSNCNFRLERSRSNPLAPIGCDALAHQNPVQHRIAIEHVVAATGLEHWVRPVAYVHTVQTGRQIASHCEFYVLRLGS